MDNKIKIGLSFTFDNKTNAGVVNYIFSFVKALNTLEDHLKPKLIIFYGRTAPIELIKEENYPYISFIPDQDTPIRLPLLIRVLNKISIKIFAKAIIPLPLYKDADYIFPFPNYLNIKHKVYWLVDFNPYYFPDHLDEKQRQDYFSYVENIVYSHEKVVLSSYEILNDLKKFHPQYTCKVELLRFAALLPSVKPIDFEFLKNKFGINKRYFICPNQFWVHKNHLVILKATQILKQKGFSFQIIFTGNKNIEKSMTYFDTLSNYVDDHHLHSYINFLGVIDRNEQLNLMKYAEAFIQPSLFEGWSTLVEESKALNKFIVLSDIPVHREQIDLNCSFFDPNDEYELANILESILNHELTIVPYDYQNDINKYANRILEIFN